MSPAFTVGPIRHRPQPSFPLRPSPARAARVLLLSSVALGAVAASSGAVRGDVTGLGFLPGYENGSYAFDVSADGSAAVGYSASFSYAAFLWTDAGGMTRIGPVATRANAISGNGQMAVGYFYNTDHTEAFVWTAAGGFVALGVNGFTESYAEGISANGDYVVGQLRGAGMTQAFVWTDADGFQLLGYLTGGRPYSMASDVSDGGIVVGRAQVITGSVQAFYKDLAASGSIQGLGYLPSGSYSAANAITPSASHIVGMASDAAGTVMAVRWVAGTPGYGPATVLNGVEGWGHSEAKGISADGRIAVGSYKIGAGSTIHHAFRWEEGSGAQALDQWLTGTGVDVTGWTFEHAEGISDDGTTIVGYGQFNSATKTQAYIARAGLLVGTTDYTESVASLRDVSRLTSSLSIAWATDGLLKTSGLPGLSISGVYSHADGSSSDLGGATLTWRQPGFAVSGGGGAVSARTSPLYQGGSAQLSGAWIGGGMVADLGTTLDAPAFTGLEASVGARADLLKAAIARNYLNGAAVQTASGETGATSFTAAARIAWHRDLAPGARITPYAQWLHNSTALDAYTETGGAGAGAVSAQSAGTNIVSVGANFDWQVHPGLELTASYAFNHMIDAKGAAASVAVPGLGTFAAPGMAYTPTWHTIGAGIAWNPSRNVQLDTTVSVNVGSSFPENWTIGSRLSLGL